MYASTLGLSACPQLNFSIHTVQGTYKGNGVTYSEMALSIINELETIPASDMPICQPHGQSLTEALSKYSRLCQS